MNRHNGAYAGRSGRREVVPCAINSDSSRSFKRPGASAAKRGRSNRSSEYTLRYPYANTTIRNDIAEAWETLRRIHLEFFLLIASDRHYREIGAFWQSRQDQYPRDTSTLKIIDNLVIGRLLIER
jgi:hypothetical protein